MTFHPRNIKHLKTTLVGVVIIIGALISVFLPFGEGPTAHPLATWADATPVLILGAGFLGIGPSKPKDTDK